MVPGRIGWPPPGAVRFGSLRRVTPVSRSWGFDRGLPVDRYYVERFLETNAESIRGRVLEVDNNAYTRQFGGDRVAQSDVLRYSEMKPGVTMVGDLASPDDLPSRAFDCVILTQTLHLNYEVDAIAANLCRILKPGGTALVTMAGISKITRDPDDQWPVIWCFSSHAAKRLFEEHFPTGQVEVVVYGNVLTATAFLYGLASEELKAEELDHLDPEFEVIVGVRATRSAGGE